MKRSTATDILLKRSSCIEWRKFDGAKFGAWSAEVLTVVCFRHFSGAVKKQKKTLRSSTSMTRNTKKQKNYPTEVKIFSFVLFPFPLEK
jgi:hypothetical protein